jgi:hypothetical protein
MINYKVVEKMHLKMSKTCKNYPQNYSQMFVGKQFNLRSKYRKLKQAKGLYGKGEK